MRRTLRLSGGYRFGVVGRFQETGGRRCWVGVHRKGMSGCLHPVRLPLHPLRGYIAASEPWAVAGRTSYYVSLESRLATLIATSDTNNHHQM